MPSLIVVAGPHKDGLDVNLLFRDLAPGQRIGLMIGRTVSAGLLLSLDSKVSERHCYIDYDGKCLSVIALRSKNGTFVHQYGSRIKVEEGDTFPLMEGDRIEVGDSIIEVVSHTLAAGKTAAENILRRDMHVRSANTVEQPKSPFPDTR